MFPHASTQAVFLVLYPVQPHSLHPSRPPFPREPMPDHCPHQGPVPVSPSLRSFLHLLQVVLPNHSPSDRITSAFHGSHCPQVQGQNIAPKALNNGLLP